MLPVGRSSSRSIDRPALQNPEAGGECVIPLCWLWRKFDNNKTVILLFIRPIKTTQKMRRKRPQPRAPFPNSLAFAALAAFAADDCYVSCFSNHHIASSVLPRGRRSSSLLHADSSGVIAAGGIDGLALAIDAVGTDTLPVIVPLNDDQRIASELTERVEQVRAAEAEKEEHNKEQLRRSNYVNVRRRRLAKEIWRDWDGALDLLVEQYPFFDTSKPSVPIMKREEFYLDGKCISSTIEVLGRSERLDEALLLLDQTADVYNIVCSTAKSGNHDSRVKRLEADMRLCYKAALSAAGNCGRWRIGHMLLQWHMPERTGLRPNAEAYHTQIASCRKCGAVDAALTLLTEMEYGRVITSFVSGDELRSVPKVDRMAYITAITACTQNKRCDDAATILTRMKRRGIEPAISEYNQVLSVYAKAGDRHRDALGLLSKIEKSANVDANKETYDIVIRCCGKDGAWNEASRIMERTGVSPADNKGSGKSQNSSSGADISKDDTYDYSKYYEDLNRLPKLGKGKDMYWEIGRCSRSERKDDDIIVGVQPHRNPKRNGVSLVFMEAANPEKKLGFMLLRHSLGDKSGDDRYDSTMTPLFSALIGMLVDEQYRGAGLSSTFVAIWLQICLDLEVFPQAEVIKKPLISAALAKFGFNPLKGGVPVEISPVSVLANQEMKWEATVALYSPKHQSLGGIYRERDLRVQKLVVASDPPSPRGTLVYVGAGFHHPMYNPSFLPNFTCQDNKEKLTRDVSTVLQRSNGSLFLNDDVDLLKKALFGFAIR